MAAAPNIADALRKAVTTEPVRVARDDQPDGHAERRRVDEEQAEGGDRADPVDRGGDDDDDADLDDEQEEEAALGELEQPRVGLDDGRRSPAVMSRPTNIHRNACDRNAVARRASGLTPRAAGEVVTPGAKGFAGVVGATGVEDVRYGLGNWFWLIGRCPPGILVSPHQAGVARVPALGQQGHFHVVVDDRSRSVP